MKGVVASLFHPSDAGTSRSRRPAFAASGRLQPLAEAACYAGFGRVLELGVRA